MQLTRHTEENLRCWAAIAVVLAGSFAAYAWLGAAHPTAPPWISIGVFAVLLTVATYIFSSRRALKPERVWFDAVRIVRTLPDGRTDSIRWEELREVVLVTTDAVPNAEGVYWMLVGRRGGCGVGAGAVGMRQLQRRLEQMPRFNHSTVVRALASNQNGSHVCWRRNVAPPVSPVVRARQRRAVPTRRARAATMSA